LGKICAPKVVKSDPAGRIFAVSKLMSWEGGNCRGLREYLGDGDSISEESGEGFCVDREGVGLDEGWVGISGSFSGEGAVEEGGEVSLAGSGEEEEIAGDKELLAAWNKLCGSAAEPESRELWESALKDSGVMLLRLAAGLSVRGVWCSK
jgi:hypothetical protein